MNFKKDPRVYAVELGYPTTAKRGDSMSFTKPQISVPADEDIVVDGVKCGVVKYFATSSYLFANLELTQEFEGRLSDWPALQEKTTHRGIYVISRGGQRQEVYSFEHASAVLVKLHAWEELKQLSAERDKLVEALPATNLNGLIQEAHERLRNYSWDAITLASITKAVQAVRSEFQRLTTSDPLEIILEDLLAERLGGWALHSHNRDVLERLESLSLRGAREYVEIPSLDQFYREKLKAAQVMTIAEFCDVDLRLKLGDYTVVSEGDEEIDWAPLEIPYPDGLVAPKNEADPKLEVDYVYKGEQRQAAACVVIPLRAFNPKLQDREETKARKRALIAAVADSSLLPELPHDHLKWWIRIEGEQKSAEGFQGEALAAQLRNLPAR